MNAKQFGWKLRTERGARTWTLSDVSALTGLSISYLSDLERGRTLPSIESAEKVAAAFDMSLAEWFGGIPASLTDEQIAVLDAYADGDLLTITRLVLTRLDALKASE